MQPYDESVSGIAASHYSLLFNADLFANYMCDDNPRGALCKSQQKSVPLYGQSTACLAISIDNAWNFVFLNSCSKSAESQKCVELRSI